LHKALTMAKAKKKSAPKLVIPPHPAVADLEDRVAALEECIRFPLRTAYFPPMCDEEMAQFREEFGKAAGPHRVILPPPPLTPDEVRQLVRECVTVVKPGETLVMRGRDWTPNQVQEIQRVMDAMHEDGTIGFKVLVVIGDELGVVAFRLGFGRLEDAAGTGPTEKP
jgi:hypothetical protein